MTAFGVNFLVDDHYNLANNYWSDLLFETGQFDFKSSPTVELTHGWITKMQPGASYTYSYGRLRSKLGPSKPRPYQFYWRGIGLHDLEVTIQQRGTPATPEWQGLVPVNNPPPITLDPSLPQFITIRNPSAEVWTGEFRFGIAEDDMLTSPAFRAWCQTHEIKAARLMDIQRAKYAEQDHKIFNLSYPTAHGDWRGDFAGITLSQGLQMAKECGWEHVWLSVPPGMQPDVLVAALDDYDGCMEVTLEHGGNEVWNRGASQKAGTYYLRQAEQYWGIFSGTPGQPQDFAQPGWVLADDAIAYTPSGQMWPDKLKQQAKDAGRVDPILLSNEAAYAMAMLDAALCFQAMDQAGWEVPGKPYVMNAHGVRIYNTMGGQNGNARFTQNILQVCADALPAAAWSYILDYFTGFSYAPYLAYQYVTRALPNHAADPANPTDAEFWAAAEEGWQTALDLYRQNVAAQPPGWRAGVYEWGLSFIDGRDGRTGDWWTQRRFSVHGEAMTLKMAADINAEGPWAAMIYGQGITGEEFVPGQPYGQGFWSVLPSWDSSSNLLREIGDKFDPAPPIAPPADEFANRLARIRADLDWIEANR